MHILIVTHTPIGSTKGNRITAERWSGFLRELGHDVTVASEIPSRKFDCLVALHATHSAATIKSFQAVHPNRPVLLCLTGTDLHLDLQGKRGEESLRLARESIARCDRLILLEPESKKLLAAEHQAKVVVIVQSAIPIAAEDRRPLNENAYEICVVGHLRDVKDPFLAAQASQHLPAKSRIQILHMGAALNESMRQQAEAAMERFPRYTWLGAKSHDETQAMMASCRAMILSSKTEGAPSVLSEAIVNGVPVLATRIPATIGLLGADYPGLFRVGDVQALCQLMTRVENDRKFYSRLVDAIDLLKSDFAPMKERALIEAIVAPH